MAFTVVRTITHPNGLRRVDIIQRDDGTFGFEEWFFSEHPYERCWIRAFRQMETLLTRKTLRCARLGEEIEWLASEEPA